ncbi:SDR family NAD(P)-dependent oxidoreductase [Nocardia gamkensis]|uniref:SDR family NAD(P)-dependent oxidoreductase n=1 Tax=Nocardia gamkensis TaxID=352869 RepID=UPI0036EEC554
MAGRLTGRVAAVTGAGQGLGRAIAHRLASEGAGVAVVDVDDARGKAVAEEISMAGGSAIAVACDVANRDEVHAAAERIAADLGAIDVLVSNAGVVRPAMLWQMTFDDWQTVLDIHLNGGFHWLQAVVPGMREAGNGRIIFTTSAAGINGTVGQVNYSAAKAALLGLTRSAAMELARYGITVNAVAPAAATAMTEKIRTDERLKDKALSKIPLQRWAEPDEIAGTYAFLASADAGYITGQVIAADGGMVMVR